MSAHVLGQVNNNLCNNYITFIVLNLDFSSSANPRSTPPPETPSDMQKLHRTQAVEPLDAGAREK